tara:strand:- start:3291 stop:4523 length:1233 start_codon:yes stop_codon:yes gene_type:complete
MVGSIVDYDPNVQTYIDEVNRVVNEIYLDFFTDRPWKFAQETEEIQVYRDVSVANGVIAIGANTITSVTNPFLPWMEGHIVEIAGAADVDNAEYVITKSIPGTLRLEGFSASANTVGLTITVKQRFVDMPADCSEVLSIGVRSPTSGTNAHFSYLSRARDEELSLLLSSTGLPTNWLIYDDATMTQPVIAPTLTQGGASTLTVGSHSLKYVFVHKGKLSAPSPSASVVLIAGRSIDVAGLQNTGANSGVLKKVYIQTPEAKAYYASTAVFAAEVATTITNATLAADYLVSGERLPENSGHYKRVRLFPRQDTDYLIEARFVYRPDRLIEETDVPEFPPDHHRYLVYRACQELFMKHDNVTHSEVYRRKSDVELLRMENTYLSEGAGYWIKRGYREGARSFRTSTNLTTRG